MISYDKFLSGSEASWPGRWWSAELFTAGNSRIASLSESSAEGLLIKNLKLIIELLWWCVSWRLLFVLYGGKT